MELSCSHWRMHLLSNAINYHHTRNPTLFPHKAKMLQLDSTLNFDLPQVQEALGDADILVYQRNVIWEAVWDSLSYWRALKKTVVCDLDDHYPNLPPSNPAHAYWIRNVHKVKPTPLERLKIGLAKTDGLIAPNRILLRDWEHVCNTYYWPNYPSISDYEELQKKPIGGADVTFAYEKDPETQELTLMHAVKPGTEGHIIIGWGGSISHVDSFIYSGVLEALARVLKEREEVYFKFCGAESRLNEYLGKLPEKKVIRQGAVTTAHWPLVLSTFDIGIAPLDHRVVACNTGNEHGEYSYDDRRSFLKAVEYLCAGIPYIASKSVPYTDKEVARFGKIVENTENAWYEALMSRVDSLAHFKKEAQDRKGNALKKFTIEHNTGRLIDFYRRIIVDAQSRQGFRLPDVIYV